MEEPVGSENTVEPEEEKHPRNNKLLLALLLVGATAIILFLGIYLGRIYFVPILSPATTTAVPTSVPTSFLTPTHDPTLNWKTYKNEEHGFSIRYPKDLFIHDEGWQATGKRWMTSWGSIPKDDYLNLFDSSPAALLSLNKVLYERGYYEIVVEVQINPKRGYLGPDNNEKYELLNKDNLNKIVYGEPDVFNIQGRPSVKNEIREASGGGSIHYYILNENKLFTVYGSSKNISKISIAEINQILSTFQFLD